MVSERGVGAGPLEVLDLDVVQLDLLLALDHLRLQLGEGGLQFHIGGGLRDVFWNNSEINYKNNYLRLSRESIAIMSRRALL